MDGSLKINLAPRRARLSNYEARTLYHSEDTEMISQLNSRCLQDEHQVTQGEIATPGGTIKYTAEAGVLVVHMNDPLDVDQFAPSEDQLPPPQLPPVASMSYFAYFQGSVEDPTRPITFVFNGGPGSASVWLHMGAFGPKRVIAEENSPSFAAPYPIVDNAYCLLNVSDVVFIDAPGTGFGHLRGEDKEKVFWSIDGDARAFAKFIVEFIARHCRWNSPKYLFGESYGTVRASVLAHVLQQDWSIALNGIILLSQILCLYNSPDQPQFNPGINQPYVLALPTYAATAWYHHKLPSRPVSLQSLLTEVEEFAMGDYARALAEGASLSPARKAEVADKLYKYTGLPAEYFERANLRVNCGEFEKTLLDANITTSRLDSRFTGPTLDPMSKEAEYDPQLCAISSAYVCAFNEYMHTTLKFGSGKTYKAATDIWKRWSYEHKPPGNSVNSWLRFMNVEPDLAIAMQSNPSLKVQVHCGYYDLATPYFAAKYELDQLPIQQDLHKNIAMHLYNSGHLVYANEHELRRLHSNISAFLCETNQSISGNRC